MPLALSIALRFLFGGRNRYARFIAWVSLAGLGLGVLVLSVVVSVMNGFDAELRTRILGTVPHVLAAPGDPALLELAEAGEGVRHAHRFFQASGMVTQNGAVAPVAIFGIDSDGARFLTQISANMISGDLQAVAADPGALALGWSLAYYLGLVPGDDLLLIVSRPVAGALRPHIKRFRLAATFEMGRISIIPWPSSPEMPFPSGNGASWGPMACAWIWKIPALRIDSRQLCKAASRSWKWRPGRKPMASFLPR